MAAVRAVWEQVYGLVVEDGWIALGAVGALIVTWLVTTLAGGDQAQRDIAGPLLIVMIAALVLANLYMAGAKATRGRRR